MALSIKLFREFLRDERGSSAVEYGLIASFVALLLISSIKPIGTKLNAKFSALSNNLN